MQKTNIHPLVINQLTEEQYQEAKEAGALNPYELYMTESDDAECIPITEKGAPNGVASLDESGKVPSDQLPSMITYQDTLSNKDQLYDGDVKLYPITRAENIIGIESCETIENKVTSLSASSTDTQYPSAKCVYDIIGDIAGGGLSYEPGEGINITWDGDTTGRDNFGAGPISFYKVSDTFISKESLIGATYTFADAEVSGSVDENLLQDIGEDCYGCQLFMVMRSGTYNGITVPSDGIYFYYDAIDGSDYTTSLTKPGNGRLTQNGEDVTQEVAELITPRGISSFDNDAGYLTLDTLPRYDGGVS